jgi:hypothetical protein
MAEHFSSDDVAAWEGTVQGNADALGEPPPEAETPPGVPEDLDDRLQEWAETARKIAEAEEADAAS